MNGEDPMTWQGDFRIPRKIRLPGVTITVKRLPDKEMLENGTHFGSWQYDFSAQSATIRINKALPIEVQRYVLIHELQHAAVELVDVMLEKYPEEVRTWQNRKIEPETAST